MAETCRCVERLATNYIDFPPYANVNVSDKASPVTAQDMTGMLPKILNEMAVSYCQTCMMHSGSGRSWVDFNKNGRNSAAKQAHAMAMQSFIEEETAFSFPVYGFKELDIYKTYHRYIPLVQSPGIAHIIFMDKKVEGSELIMTKIFETWPLIVITLLMAIIAGMIMWFLVRSIALLAILFRFPSDNLHSSFQCYLSVHLYIHLACITAVKQTYYSVIHQTFFPSNHIFNQSTDFIVSSLQIHPSIQSSSWPSNNHDNQS